MMNLIMQTIIITYLFLLVPFHFGILWTGIFSKRQKKISEVFTNGYLLMMAVFWCIAVVSIQKGSALSELARVWLIVSMLVSVAANIFFYKKIQLFVKDMITFWKNGQSRMVGLLVVFLVCSVFFTRPSILDETLEIVQTAVATDTMYQYDVYTGSVSEEAAAGHMFAPIEMLYAAADKLTGMEPYVMLYYMVPVGLLCFFYCAIWRIGNQLIKKKENLVFFVGIVTAIYWMTTYLTGQSVLTGIFLNSWNGLTLLSCCIMPIAFGELAEWMAESEKGKIGYKIEKICTAAVLLLAGQLTDEKGGFYIGLMLLISTAVMIVRKGDDYGITSGRFKKRV